MSEAQIEAEEWRPVVGWEDMYLVSNRGGIKSLYGRKDGPIATFPVRGYLSVNLCKDGTLKQKKVHCLVAEAFLGPRVPGMQVNHKDGDKLNPLVANLEYVTASQNMRHAYDTGLNVHARGEDWCRSKLSEQDVREIRARVAGGEQQRAIGREFGVAEAQISRIVNRTRWAHVA